MRLLKGCLALVSRHVFSLTVGIIAIGFIAFLLSTAEKPGQVRQSNTVLEMKQLIGAVAFQHGLPASEQVRAGGQIWSKAAEQAGVTLWFDSAGGQIMLQRASGERLFSNPPADELQGLSGSGVWHESLTSPFVLYYLLPNDVNVKISNTAAAKAAVSWTMLEDGVGIRYEMAAIGMTMYVEYRLDNGELLARIPRGGVAEHGEQQLAGVELLPFLGAAEQGAIGSLLVPDGAGGLIHMKDETSLIAKKMYSYPVYGRDPALGDPKGQVVTRRSPIAYPIFGIIQEKNTVLAIVEEGQARATIAAGLAGMRNNYHFALASFAYRQQYERPKGMNRSELVYESNLINEPVSIRYLWANQEQRDYVSLAHMYRDYFIGRAGVEPLAASAGEPVLFLNVAIGSTESTSLGQNYVSATTYEEIVTMVDRLLSEGISNIEVGLSGWQTGGYLAKLPKRLPVAGGRDELDELSRQLAKRQVALRLDDHLYYASSRGNGFSPRREAARGINGYTLSFSSGSGQGSYYYIQPQAAVKKYVPEARATWTRLGIGKIGLLDGANLLYSSYERQNRTSRSQALGIAEGVLADIRGATDELAVAGGFAYAVPYARHMFEFPLASNYDLIVDEPVPFYPIAVHGLVTYSSVPGNLRGDPQTDFLRDLEYGALPAYLVTQAAPSLLKDTFYKGLYSSEFNTLLPQIIKEYHSFAEVQRDVWGSYIAGHQKLAENVYETAYSNGKRIWVNYSEQPFTSGEWTVKAQSYLVIGGDNE